MAIRSLFIKPGASRAFSILTLLLVGGAWAQSNVPASPSNAVVSNVGTATSNAAVAAASTNLPASAKSNAAIGGWDVFVFGMPPAEVMSNLEARWGWMALEKNSRDDIPSAESGRIVRVKPNRHFDRLDFLFRSGKLYMVRIDFSERKYSWLGLRAGLADRYGEPDVVAFKDVQWLRGSTRLTLERPNKLRYLNLEAIRPSTNRAATPLPGSEPRIEDVLKTL